MRQLFLILFFFVLHANAQQHCGYDFTSFLVLHIHESGAQQNISGLRLTIVDANQVEVYNKDNQYSWSSGKGILQFSENYQIDNRGGKLPADQVSTGAKWYFPYSKASYLLSVANTFPADDFQVKIDDPTGTYKPMLIPLYSYNMFVLCSSEQQKAMQFGRRQNKPIEVVLERK